MLSIFTEVKLSETKICKIDNQRKNPTIINYKIIFILEMTKLAKIINVNNHDLN